MVQQWNCDTDADNDSMSPTTKTPMMQWCQCMQWYDIVMCDVGGSNNAKIPTQAMMLALAIMSWHKHWQQCCDADALQCWCHQCTIT